MNNKYFYKDKDIFGLDIGFKSVKVMQIKVEGKHRKLVGYGFNPFSDQVIKDSVIVDFETLAEAIKELFSNKIVGEITTRRVAMSIPTSSTYTRTFNLPSLSDEETEQAVNLEAEQYIPLPRDDLYLDYDIISRTKDNLEVSAVGVPKKVVDSYRELCDILDLEPVMFDSSINAASRLFEQQKATKDIPAVLMDFGSIAADISIHDRTNVVSSTLPAGGDTFTEAIAGKLKVNHEEAHIIKTKYGLGKSKKQNQIIEALQPELDKIVREVKRMVRYYEDRSETKSKIGQVVSIGGGANMPGLSDYLTNMLRIPVRTYDPWQEIEADKHKAPSNNEKSLYVTAAGLAFIDPRGLF
jgi:type IV pilus assembly protein PilM